MKSFKLTDSEYEQFVAWVKNQKFNYTTELENKVETIIALAKNEKSFDQLQPLLKELKNGILISHHNDFSQYKTEISEALEQEIAFHYYLFQGQIDVGINKDLELTAAKKLLIDQVRFKQLLSPE